MQSAIANEATESIARFATRQAPVSRRDGVFMEHRFGQRFRCGTAVRLSAVDGVIGGGRLANVSLSGAYVETALDLPLFALVVIAAERDERKVEMHGCVVRKDSSGVGVEWSETPARPICRIFGCTKQCEAA
jgi:hypothetical protein